MIKLVIEYVCSDGCTYSFTNSIPVQYHSAEAFAVDFEAAWTEARLSDEFEFDFAGKSWDREDFRDADPYVFSMPRIFTVDEWFAYHKS